MKLIVGLGNPGDKYKDTRHNAGFKVCLYLAKQGEIKLEKKLKNSRVGTVILRKRKIILAQPQSFMNNSGENVLALLNWFKITTNDLIVISDDFNLDLGKIRIRRSGSDGGHNGLKSIIQYLNDKNFYRIRIGIGAPPENYLPENYVLGKFPLKEIKIIDEAIEDAAAAVGIILERGIEIAMQQFNS